MNPRINIRLTVGMAAIFSAALVACCPCEASSEQSDETAVQVSALPDYSFPYNNGLYATITGYLKLKHVGVPGETTLHLSVNGFRQPMTVHSVLQDHEAPLVVVIPGINGKADSDFTKLWPSWYANAGYNVLYFDSTFRPELVGVVGKGVSGNVWSEAESVRDIISAYLNLETVRARVTKIGLVGQSYGGVIALILGQMAKEGQLPFPIDAIQAYSPPIDLQKTADLFDRWYNQNRWCFTLVQLMKEVGQHKPVEGGTGVPLSNREMKAAIVAAFHLELIPVVMANDGYYGLNQLPHGDQFDDQSVRFDGADTYGFTKYAYGMAFPYWRPILGPGRIEELIAATNLNEILKHQPPCSETILASDDPFNLPEDLSELEAHAAELPLTILPNGGHLGYVGESWTRSKLLRIFDCGTRR
jgi:predicted alpha/beta-fold hydrolase